LFRSLADAGWLGRAWLDAGPYGVGWLRPQQLFGLGDMDPLTHGAMWSLLFNIATMVLVSRRWGLTLSERLHAEPFLNPYAEQLRRRSPRSEEHTSELQSRENLVCRL